MDNGELEGWPEGFFDQKRQDLRELLEIRRCGS
jgi:predicted ATPase